MWGINRADVSQIDVPRTQTGDNGSKKQIEQQAALGTKPSRRDQHDYIVFAKSPLVGLKTAIFLYAIGITPKHPRHDARSCDPTFLKLRENLPRTDILVRACCGP